MGARVHRRGDGSAWALRCTIVDMAMSAPWLPRFVDPMAVPRHSALDLSTQRQIDFS
jgi:hypothetical protein